LILLLFRGAFRNFGVISWLAWMGDVIRRAKFFGDQLILLRGEYFSLREMHQFILNNFLRVYDSQSWRVVIREFVVKLGVRSVLASREEIKMLKREGVVGLRTPKTLLIHCVDAYTVIGSLTRGKNGYRWKPSRLAELKNVIEGEEKVDARPVVPPPPPDDGIVPIPNDIKPPFSLDMPPVPPVLFSSLLTIFKI